MSIPAGTHRLGPDNATLSVRTKRAGAAAKAGHDLLLRVTDWEATIDAGDAPAQARIDLRADAGSLRVIEGTGGIQELTDDDISSIHQTVDDEVLRRERIEFRSTDVRPSSAGRLTVEGELTILGRANLVSFELELADDGTLRGTAVVKQTKWGMKPYSALFGALKVHDDVEVELEGKL